MYAALAICCVEPLGVEYDGGLKSNPTVSPTDVPTRRAAEYAVKLDALLFGATLMAYAPGVNWMTAASVFVMVKSVSKRWTIPPPDPPYRDLVSPALQGSDNNRA